ncbi:group II intron reverse transcriptase/maturase [Escherichia coli]|nr:group II intron reverse transcriptase/maturase [Escherichia coli]
MSTHCRVSSATHGAHWHLINWRYCHRRVKKLQLRIAKATQEQQWRKVKVLQRMLTRSFSAKALAVKRVTENTGRKTPGVDGEIWQHPESKWSAITRLKRSGYHPLPLRRIYIPKANGKFRALGIPTMLDRAMQALYLMALEPLSEITADHHNYGFRPMRSTADAIEQVFNACGKKASAEWILEGDIRGCFDNLSHEWLLSHIPMDRMVLRNWLKSGYCEGMSFYPTKGGTPQGGIISPTLMNMALDGLQSLLERRFPSTTVQGRKAKIHLVRYADDFVITGATAELLRNDVMPIVIDFLAERGLMLSPEKTRIVNIKQGVDFLGQNIRKYKGKLLIKPSRMNLKNFLHKIRSIIEKNKASPAWLLISQLNPVIRGWVNYHRHVVAKKMFRYIDHQIWLKVWQWCVRRHPKKGKRWIRNKYFTTIGMRNWVFSGNDGMNRKYTLFKADSTPIKRHTKIKAIATPYDPKWESYFERRQDYILENAIWGKKRLLAIWRSQGSLCPICRQRITHETGWNVHHKVKKVMGGGEELSNLVLLHPNCHRQLHSCEAGSLKKGL